MSTPWTVSLVSAFGRGETLALGLHENGFKVQLLDFTAAFPAEYQRGLGPFPIVDKEFFPAQREALKQVERLPQGLTFWLKDGPIELTGPMSGVHIHSHPEIQAWKTNSLSGDFSRTWLQQFLRQWASPFFSESWNQASDLPFPAEMPLGLGHSVSDFSALRAKSIEVLTCANIRDVQFQGPRIASVEVETGGKSLAAPAHQWVWCLSSSETARVGSEGSKKLFGRSVYEPEWTWLSFAGQMQKGPWTAGLPRGFVVIGDEFLPWCYANVSMVQRSDETRFRIWIKVPRSRMGDIDARRGWASDLLRLLMQRLPLAGWKVDSADWNICPHSEVFSPSDRGGRIHQWKNQILISPEVLPRLDWSARLEAESEAFRRLVQWRNDQLKKQGARRDHALHAT